MRDLSVYAKDAAAAVEMRHALENYGIEVNRAGYALCPFHDEKTGSLKVYPHSFYCYGCGKGGDVITLVRSLFDLSFRDALIKVNADFALGLPIDKKPTIRQRRAAQEKRRELERAQMHRQRAHIENWESYLDLVVEWELCGLYIRNYKPVPGDDTLHPWFVKALRRRDYLDYLMNSYVFYEEESA